jgi:hypothetical protein
MEVYCMCSSRIPVSQSFYVYIMPKETNIIVSMYVITVLNIVLIHFITIVNIWSHVTVLFQLLSSVAQLNTKEMEVYCMCSSRIPVSQSFYVYIMPKETNIIVSNSS